MSININAKDLKNQYFQIATMRSLLSLDDTDGEFSAYGLQKIIDYNSMINLIWLVNLIYYMKSMPKSMKKFFNTFDLENKNNFYSNMKEFKEKLKKDDDFINFDNFIFCDITQEATNTFERETKYENFEELKSEMFSIKKTMLILIYNVTQELYNKDITFEQNDITLNLPFLYLWIKKNSLNCIKPLNEDECDLISCFMSGSEIKIQDEFIKNYDILRPVFKNISAKFQVENIIQVIFKLLLINPYLLDGNYDITNEIKSMSSVCFLSN